MNRDPLPKTIQIFLPDGNARSVRIAEITSRTVQAIQVPRSKVRYADSRDEPKSVGIYFLFGIDDEGTKPLVYIGEAENCYDRLLQHHRSKDFWNTAVIIRSRTRSFTKAHVKYLEGFCYQRAESASRYRLTNSSVPSQSYVSEPVKADLLDNFDTMRILLSTLGFPIFEEVDKPRSARPVESKTPTPEVPPDTPTGDSPTPSAQGRLLICEGRGGHATGEYIEDGLVVFEGSTAAPDTTKSARQARRIRKKLENEGTLHRDSDDAPFNFTKDHVFSSPSAASRAVLGRSSNGWIAWKTEDGKTLKEVERQ